MVKDLAESNPVKSLDLPTPMAIGRIFRLIIGIFLLSVFNIVIPQFTGFLSGDIPTHVMFWAGVGLSFYFLNQAVNVGFHRDWGRKPQLVFLLLALGTIPLNVLLFGGLWGAPLGILLYLLVLYFTGHVGVSFIFAAILRTPGCEMASIHQLRDREGFESCEGGVDRLDRWETRWRKK